jgi:hypothetical protein
LTFGPLEFRWSRFTWLAGKLGEKRVAAEMARMISDV